MPKFETGRYLNYDVCWNTPNADNTMLPVRLYYGGADGAIKDVKKVPLEKPGANYEFVTGDLTGMYIDGKLVYLGMPKADLEKLFGPTCLGKYGEGYAPEKGSFFHPKFPG